VYFSLFFKNERGSSAGCLPSQNICLGTHGAGFFFQGVSGVERLGDQEDNFC